MSKSRLFNSEIIHKIKTAQDAVIVEKPQIGVTGKRNELVFFIKPELLKVEEDIKIQNSLKLIEEKFRTFEVDVEGAVIVPGHVLEQQKIMNRHYGFINQLSRKASDLIDPATRQEIFKILNQADHGKHLILGGHQFLETFDTDVDTLSEVWFAQEAKKLRSGFYFIEDSFQDESIILVNGFHPSQLQHFTNKEHRILLMLLHTDTDWEAMKFDLVGDTFPERAKFGSIRGALYANPELYGQPAVGINTNGVHLSAGPFEAAFEVVNFFGPILDLDPSKTPPLALKKAVAAGISEERALSLLENPKLNQSDLFTETENLDTLDAVELIRKNLAEN